MTCIRSGTVVTGQKLGSFTALVCVDFRSVGVRGYSGDHDWSLDEVMKLVREESKVLGQTVAWEG